MNKRTRHKFTYYGFSLLLSIVFFVAGSRMLYADFRRTTTVTTTTTIPPANAPQPVVALEQPAVVQQPAVVEQPAVVHQPAVVQQPAVVEQPAVVKQPGVVEQPAVVQKPAVIQQPAVVEHPAVVTPTAVIPQQVHEYITFGFDIKKVFQSNENVMGDVIINNASAVPLADSFHTKIYHNGKLVKELLTKMSNIPPGQTRFSLAKFGIPQINETTASQGDWTISTYDLDPAYTKNADFRIINSTSSNNLLR